MIVGFQDKHYLCIMASDTPDQNLSQYFSVCNDFIHAARLRDGNVLIHCLAGMSRSVTVAVAYIMCVTHLSWKESLKVVRTGRAVANPNMGFQTQLNDFEMYKLVEVSKLQLRHHNWIKLKKFYPKAQSHSYCRSVSDYANVFRHWQWKWRIAINVPWRWTTMPNCCRIRTFVREIACAVRVVRQVAHIFYHISSPYHRGQSSRKKPKIEQS